MSKDIYAPAPLPDRVRKQERVAIITGNETEDLEFFYPYYRLTEAGYQVDVITESGGAFSGKHGLTLQNSKAITEVLPEDYVLLYLPGGKAPAKLAKNQQVLSFITSFAKTNRPIAAICHGPQLLVAAGLVRGRTLSAYPEVAKEIEQAGGKWVDEALQMDGQFITARVPGDLHRHLDGVFEALQGKNRVRGAA